MTSHSGAHALRVHVMAITLEHNAAAVIHVVVSVLCCSQDR